jgi:hypothetical protein
MKKKTSVHLYMTTTTETVGNHNKQNWLITSSRTYEGAESPSLVHTEEGQ